jgi:hypothetical protein
MLIVFALRKSALKRAASCCGRPSGALAGVPAKVLRMTCTDAAIMRVSRHREYITDTYDKQLQRNLS